MHLRVAPYPILAALVSLGAAVPTSAHASEQPPAASQPGAQASGSVSLAGPQADASATPPAQPVSVDQPVAVDQPAAADQPSIAHEGGPAPEVGEPNEGGFRRWRPQRNMVELGIYGGAFWLNSRHQFYGGAEKNEVQRWRKFPGIIPEVGLRFGYYPASFLGLEIEGSLLPTKAKATATSKAANALIWAGRGHLILQLPLGNLVPFILGGAGALGIHSPDGSGDDADLAAHVGGGLKLFLSKHLALRLDARDVIATRRTSGTKLKNHNFEALLGLSLTFGRKDPVKPAPAPEPLPPPPADTDGDGIVDPSDSCPQVAELINQVDDLDGCPETDRDGDGFWDFPAQDTCPDQAGIAPDGCPPKDTDGDGIMDPDDKCVDQPETKNGYEDSDGCPDEVPQEEVAKFSGSIDGIVFDTGKATIAASSYPTLDRAVELLKKYPTLKLEISGHTDSVGNNAKNLKLSQDRADSVKNYIAGAGVDAARLTTRGAGETEPIADNRKKDGRAKNRRIEFKIAQQ